MHRKSPPTSEPPKGGGGYCDPNTNICYDPLSNGVELFLVHTQSVGPLCTGALAPKGFHENYNLQKHLKIIKRAINIANIANLQAAQIGVQKTAIFAALMMPFGLYDFKRTYNPYYTKKGADAGNYNYGYIGAELGFSDDLLRNMSGVIQLIKNNNASLDDLFEAVKNNDFTEFDNPGDQVEVNRGISASKSGCMPSHSNYNGGSAGSNGSFTGWSGISRALFGVDLCLGCPTHGKIVDPPPGGFPENDRD